MFNRPFFSLSIKDIHSEKKTIIHVLSEVKNRKLINMCGHPALQVNMSRDEGLCAMNSRKFLDTLCSKLEFY